MDALRRVEAGLLLPELCRDMAISTATLFNWLSKCVGINTSMMSSMKEPEEENRRLKTLYGEAQLKADIVAEALAKKW